MNWILKLKSYIGKLNRQKVVKQVVEEEISQEENRYLGQLRFILEQVLEHYNRNYQEFRPLLLDTDTPPESMLEEDEVQLVLEQISKDLNFLKIATHRPAYFAPYIDKMYEDTGLVVQVEEKSLVSNTGVNVILDMEQKQSFHNRLMGEDICYIPIYKKPWKQGGNLDISVPIGYNTVIVKGI